MAGKAVNPQGNVPSAGEGALRVWAIAGEIGLIIALPLLLLLFIGIRLDRWAGTMPLFIIIGLLASLAVSAGVIARKISRL